MSRLALTALALATLSGAAHAAGVETRKLGGTSSKIETLKPFKVPAVYTPPTIGYWASWAQMNPAFVMMRASSQMTQHMIGANPFFQMQRQVMTLPLLFSPIGYGARPFSPLGY